MYIIDNDLVIVAWWDNAKGYGTTTKSVTYWEGMHDEIWWLEKSVRGQGEVIPGWTLDDCKEGAG
jgi:hypothetical protein